jgi:hypothetical protein
MVKSEPQCHIVCTDEPEQPWWIPEDNTTRSKWPINLDMNTLILDNILPDELGIGRLSGPGFRFNYSGTVPVPGNPLGECWGAMASCVVITLMFSRCCTFRHRDFRSKVYTEEWEEKMQPSGEHTKTQEQLALGPVYTQSQPSGNEPVQFQIYKFGTEGDDEDDGDAGMEGALVVREVSVQGQAAAAVAKLQAKADAEAKAEAADDHLSELDLKIMRAEQRVKTTMRKKFDLEPSHDEAPGQWNLSEAPWRDSSGTPWTAQEVDTAKSRADARGRVKLKPLGEIRMDFKQLKKAQAPSLNSDEVKKNQIEGKMVFFGGKGDIDMMLLNVGNGNDVKAHPGISDDNLEDQQCF